MIEITVDDLLKQVMSGKDPEYQAKMMHKIPEAPVVDRNEAIINAVKGRVALELGCAESKLSTVLDEIAKKLYGMDKIECQGENFIQVDFDKDEIPLLEDVEVVICGEVIEHLSNPGFFLDNLRKYKCHTLFTVPNALTTIGLQHARKGFENVNKDHVAYYSWKTFTTLLERHKWQIDYFWWYNGEPVIAEGLIFLAR